jgi:hypothetical protein
VLLLPSWEADPPTHRRNGAEEGPKFLDRKIREVANELEGLKAYITPKQEKVTVNEILDDLVENYKRGGKRRIHREAPPQMTSHLNPLRGFFGTWRAIQVGSRHIEEFKSKLKAERKANATVNRSLQLLGQAYNYAITSDPAKLSRAPKIERYSEQGNERKGKFTPSEAEAIFNNLPPYMADVARFAYETGHRSNEVRKAVLVLPGARCYSRPGANREEPRRMPDCID